MRVHVADTSSRKLQEHVAAARQVMGDDSHVSMAQVPGWSDAVQPGDIVVADYFVSRAELATAGMRGARWLHILSTGIENFPVADLDFTEMTSSRGISGGPIAEYIFAMVLAREKSLLHLLTDGNTSGPLGELRGQTLAVFGFGAIGSHAARLALAFGMQVVAMRRSGRPLPVEFESVRMVDDIHQLVAVADHLVLCAPLTNETRSVIGRSVLERMRPTAHIINVARGGLIDQEALISALDGGRLGHATLDVTEPEPLADAHPLMRHPRVTVTRHLSGRVAAAEQRNWAPFLENLARLRDGQPLLHLVDRVNGY